MPAAIRSLTLPLPVTAVGIDTGPSETGWIQVHVDIASRLTVLDGGVSTNEELLEKTRSLEADVCGIEKIACMRSGGMGVSDSVFDSSELVGKYALRMEDRGIPVCLIKRPSVLSILLGKKAKNTDSAVRSMLIDRFGPQGTKKSPGRTYGVKSHMWSAFAVAVSVLESNCGIRAK